MQNLEILVRKPTEGEIEYISKEITWESDPCEFDFDYDHNETALVIYGCATLRYPGGEVTVVPVTCSSAPRVCTPTGSCTRRSRNTSFKDKRMRV